MANKSLLDLSPELRLVVYKQHFSSTGFYAHDPNQGPPSETCDRDQGLSRGHQNILLTCKTINAEATPIWLAEAIFVIGDCDCFGEFIKLPFRLPASLRTIRHLDVTSYTGRYESFMGRIMPQFKGLTTLESWQMDTDETDILAKDLLGLPPCRAKNLIFSCSQTVHQGLGWFVESKWYIVGVLVTGQQHRRVVLKYSQNIADHTHTKDIVRKIKGFCKELDMEITEYRVDCGIRSEPKGGWTAKTMLCEEPEMARVK